MIRNWTIAALAACLVVPAVAATQVAAPRARTRPRVRVETNPFGVYTFGETRGRIGVVVKTDANAADDKVGARIEAVTPGGPADDAGLKAGDIITRFNGTALGGVRAEETEQSGPGMKLIDLARALDPGDTVQVDYRRGSDNRKATIVAEDLGWASTGMIPGMRSWVEDQSPGGAITIGPEGNFRFAFGGPWGDIEMVKLNPDLGDYFGTREGVLVVRAPEDSSLALKGGDVIVSIGGRKPTSPEQAMRILRSYDPGETVTMDVLRKQRHVNVTWKVPEEEGGYRRLLPRMREEPSRYQQGIELRELRSTRSI